MVYLHQNMVQLMPFHGIMMGLTTIIRIESLPNSLLYGQDSAETVRRLRVEAPFQHCPDRIIVKLEGIVLCQILFVVKCLGYLFFRWI